ncbi:MAG: radical SAM protein [Nitrospirae bacterium]|nr:radical SAM protein [Nitrospirota bacterium]
MGKYYKPSRYNFFIPESGCGDLLLFNGLRSSLIRMPSGIHPIAQNILSLGRLNLAAITSEIRPLFATLKEGGFMVNADLDEVSIIKKRLRRIRESGPLHLIIAPTLECNLACKYCYQFRSFGSMTEKVCNQIIGFVGQELKKGAISSLRVDWYGGEPLLSPKIISYLSGHFLKLAKRFNCEYEATIATNGTLLNDSAVKLLMENKVKSCQVTIDGPKEIHDKRRGYKNNKGSSFDRILKNMRRIIGKSDLSVRINIDMDNIPYAFSLLEIFKEEGFFGKSDTVFSPYMAMVGPINPNRHLRCMTVSTSTFYKHSLEFQKMAFKLLGRKQLKPLLDFPYPVNAACGALRKNTYAFDPRGYYFKCGLEIGEHGKECGHASNAIKMGQCKKWDEYNPLDDKQCLECRYLPFCMGYCPKTKFDGNSFYSSDGCVYWKENLEDIIRLYVDAMEEIKR